LLLPDDPHQVGRRVNTAKPGPTLAGDPVRHFLTPGYRSATPPPENGGESKQADYDEQE
jgi:hypothetical protein